MPFGEEEASLLPSPVALCSWASPSRTRDRHSIPTHRRSQSAKPKKTHNHLMPWPISSNGFHLILALCLRSFSAPGQSGIPILTYPDRRLRLPHVPSTGLSARHLAKQLLRIDLLFEVLIRSLNSSRRAPASPRHCRPLPAPRPRSA